MELQTESPETVLRVTVEGGGCSGFQYKFELDNERHPDDMYRYVCEFDGVRLLRVVQCVRGERREAVM